MFECVYDKGLILMFFIVYTQQETLSNEEFQLDKRRADGHARTSIPLFRGSNLGIFVRKRPMAAFADHSVIRRKETRSPSMDDERMLYEINSDSFQRRFDDYSDNPGPMFGR